MEHELKITTLDGVTNEEFHEAFIAAFADYQMDTSHVTVELLHHRFIKNAVDPSLSVGAFDNDRLVGFTAIGIDDFDSEKSAFDAATGIVKEYRGQGLAKAMFDFITPKLQENNVKKFYLEVLCENEPAIKAYKKVGFDITRRFNAYQIKPGEYKLPENDFEKLEIQAISKDQVLAFRDQADWLPSWENSFNGIERITNEMTLLGAFKDGKCVGELAYYPTMNWIMSLYVDKNQRGQAVASQLIERLVNDWPEGWKDIRLVNVEKNDDIFNQFLLNRGFTKLIEQYEMSFDL